MIERQHVDLLSTRLGAEGNWPPDCTLCFLNLNGICHCKFSHGCQKCVRS